MRGTGVSPGEAGGREVWPAELALKGQGKMTVIVRRTQTANYYFNVMITNLNIFHMNPNSINDGICVVN